MYKIKMLKNTKGSPNGYDVAMYLKGEIYTVNESLYNSFKSMGVCELYKPNKPKKGNTKKVNPVIENKAIASEIE